MLHNAVVVIAVIGIVGYVIGRQLMGEALRGKRLILLPAILTVIGAVDLHDGRHPQTIDLVFIAVSALVAAGIGFGQGAMIRLEERNGGLWGRLPVQGLWLWGALVASRLVIDVVAGVSGAHLAASTAPILFTLGVNRLAQAAAIAPRALHAGIPFAAEKDGSRFLGDPSVPTGPSTGRQLVSVVGGVLQDRIDQRRERR